MLNLKQISLIFTGTVAMSVANSFASVAVLATPVPAPVFDLSGTFAPTDLVGTTGLAGGSFDGTFSYSGGAVPATSTELLSSFSINVLSANNVVVETFNSNNPGNSGVIIDAGNPAGFGTDQLMFQNTDTSLRLALPADFEGTGSLTTNNYLPSVFLYNNYTSMLFVTSATSSPISQSVPEPSMIAGTIAAGAALMVARLKNYKKEKAFQAA